MAIVVTHTKVSAIPDGDDSSLIRPSDWNQTHTLVGLGTAAELNAGVANGVATLDSGGQVPLSQLPPLGELNYQGTWNATTNTPTLTSSVGTKGYYYVVSVAGTTNLNGITDWQIGDWAVFNGTVWQKVDNTDSVTSVNGLTGTVVLTTTNIAEGTNEYFTTAKARTSVSAGTGISYNNTTGVITNSSPSLGGDVVGPASATDNAIARFDTTTGKLIQNSIVTVSDTGAISGVINETFTSVTAPTYAEGRVFYDSTANTLCYYNDNNQMTVNIGQENIVRVRNQTGADITDGTVVYVNGATGNTPTIAKAIATSFTTADIIGVTTTTIANNEFGYVTINGLVNGLDTSAFTEGQPVFLSPTTAGTYTATEPTRPNYSIQVGIILRANPSVGTLLVSLQLVSSESQHIIGTIAVNQGGTGQTTYTDGQLLIGNTTGNTLAKATLTAGTGISVTNSAGGITIANTAPSSGGTVTSVGLSAPSIFSVGGSPVTSSGTLALTYSGTALPLANGGTNATSAPMAMANLMGFTSTATAGGTTTLDNTSSYYQLFTGTTTQTVRLPVTSTLQQGWTFHICNNSTGSVTVQSSGANTLITVLSGTTVMCTCIATGGTGIADWEAGYTDVSTATGSGSLVLASGPTITGTLTAASISASGTINFNSTANTISFGSASNTTAMTFGLSTVSQTTNIQAGATASGSTKTLNIGTGGLAGSTTTINIGSSVNGTSTTTVNGVLRAGTGVTGGIAGGTF
jgi:hypothetical protein